MTEDEMLLFGATEEYIERRCLQDLAPTTSPFYRSEFTIQVQQSIYKRPAKVS